jgi:hypothetical protein
MQFPLFLKCLIFLRKVTEKRHNKAQVFCPHFSWAAAGFNE